MGKGCKTPKLGRSWKAAAGWSASGGCRLLPSSLAAPANGISIFAYGFPLRLARVALLFRCVALARLTGLLILPVAFSFRLLPIFAFRLDQTIWALYFGLFNVGTNLIAFSSQLMNAARQNYFLG